MTDEIWKPVAHALLGKNYEVSSHGRVRRSTDGVGRAHQARAGRILSPQSNGKSGHLGVSFRVQGNNEPKRFLVHRLVLEAFVGPCPEGMECCHNDSNPANNRVENLRWDTRSANTRDRSDYKLPRLSGERNAQAKLSADDVRIIRSTPRQRGSQRQLAYRFGVSESTISLIVLGKKWQVAA